MHFSHPSRKNALRGRGLFEKSDKNLPKWVSFPSWDRLWFHRSNVTWMLKCIPQCQFRRSRILHWSFHSYHRNHFSNLAVLVCWSIMPSMLMRILVWIPVVYWTCTRGGMHLPFLVTSYSGSSMKVPSKDLPGASATRKLASTRTCTEPEFPVRSYLIDIRQHSNKSPTLRFTQFFHWFEVLLDKYSHQSDLSYYTDNRYHLQSTSSHLTSSIILFIGSFGIRDCTCNFLRTSWDRLVEVVGMPNLWIKHSIQKASCLDIHQYTINLW